MGMYELNRRSATKRVVMGLLLVLCMVTQGWLPLLLAHAEPEDARLAQVTPKPWEVADTTATPTATPMITVEPDVADTPATTNTELPSSLSGLDDPEVFAQTSSTPVQQENVLPGVLGLTQTSIFRVLLIGTDAYQLEDAGRSDTMIVLQVDTQTNEVKMISFLRDLYVAIPGHGKTRLNAAYVYGGAKLLRRTLSQDFGVTVDRTLAVNFSLMVDVVDQLGGICVEVSEKERKQLNSILKFYNKKNGNAANDGLLESSGVQWLSGKQALCYSRIRKIDSDFERAHRQRKVLEGVYQRVRELDALSLASIVSGTMAQVQTDLTLPDAMALLPVLLRLEDVTFDSLTIPVKGGYKSQTISGMMVLVPSLDRNRNEIAVFLAPDTQTNP